MQIVVGAETPPSRKKRGKGGATPNWEFDGKVLQERSSIPLLLPRPLLPSIITLLKIRLIRVCFLSPLRGFFTSFCVPTACSVGCILSPLRGWGSWSHHSLWPRASCVRPFMSIVSRRGKQVPPLRRRVRSGSGRNDK